MAVVAGLCGLAGLILGTSANVFMLLLLAPLMFVASFFAVFASGGSLSAGLVAAAAGLVALQIGYMATVIGRAAWRDTHAKQRQPASY